ncbi:hypothetical protein ZWY2020_019817 [Hordeum vulgare]|nr:hypothetical protein ZWY2020_019817 [Hordeum vulgare]
MGSDLHHYAYMRRDVGSITLQPPLDLHDSASPMLTEPHPTLHRYGLVLLGLESLSGEHPPSLESLLLDKCRTLASLPNEQQAYGSLKWLTVTCCPDLKKLPRCVLQQLGSIDDKELDACCEEFKPFTPKTWKWKGVPGIVRERKEPTEIGDHSSSSYAFTSDVSDP